MFWSQGGRTLIGLDGLNDFTQVCFDQGDGVIAERLQEIVFRPDNRGECGLQELDRPFVLFLVPVFYPQP